MRIRLVIPAALLVAAAYAKGRRDAAAARPVAPRACELSDDVRRRAEAEAADAFALAGERPARPAPVPVPEPVVVPEPVAAPEPVAVEERVAPAAAEVAATVAPAAPVAPPPATPAVWDVPEFPFAAARAPRPAAPRRADEGTDLASLSEWSVAPAPAAAAPAPEPVAVPEPEPEPIAVPVPDPVAEVSIDEEGRFSLGGWAAQAGDMALCGVTFRARCEHPPAEGDIRLVPDAVANVADGGLLVLGDAGFAPDSEGFTLVVAAAGPGAFAATGRWERIAA
ncbi:MAG: hypothetical protein AB7V62_03965 [Thermoleophilia bacterium]